MGNIDEETFQLFITESVEHLLDIENDLLAIEKAGADIDEELVNKVYRAAHSIKGSAGFMGLSTIGALTHEMENILGRIRSREMIPNTQIINVLLLASDKLRDLVKDPTSSNDMDVATHVEALKAIEIETSVESEIEEKKKESEVPLQEIETIDIKFPGRDIIFSLNKAELADSFDEGKRVYLIELDLIEDVHRKNKSFEGFIKEITSTGSILAREIDLKEIGMLDQKDLPSSVPLIIVFATILKPEDLILLFSLNKEKILTLGANLIVSPLPDTRKSKRTAVKKAPQKKVKMQKDKKKLSPKEVVMETDDIIMAAAAASTPETSLRVHVSLLDNLMTLAGELVLSRNQLLQSIATGDKRISESAGQRIDLITSELQEAIMLTRMQPISNVFNKFPRVVRDLSRALGKEVELGIEGREVELDKTIIEAINDPLTHLVRNAVDHGIELPDERIRMGKNSIGSIFLRAYHSAGQVNIEISDDGRGLDGERLAATAVSKGLITEDQARMMSDKEKINLIFLPGFTTAKEVSSFSGRGVGMDVVKTNLDKLGGQTDVESQLGVGTSVRIKLPLTLAIIPSQITLTGGERYAIPQVNLEELLRIPASQVKDRIERVGDAEVVRLRGNLLPLIRLTDVIGARSVYYDPNEKIEKVDKRKNIADRRSKKSSILKNAEKDKNEEKVPDRNIIEREQPDRRYLAQSALNIVVVSTGAMKYGLVVDQLCDSEEIVVKPLGRHLKNCKGYAGATIMGDGRVALILDVGNLARMAGLTSLEGSDRAAEVTRKVEEERVIKTEMQSLLVFRSAVDEQFAVPLSQVERIEKINEKMIEDVGGKKVMQYRGGSLALFTIDQVADVRPLASDEDLLVIVFSITEREIGLLGIGPIDAVEVSTEIDETTLRQSGIVGSMIVGENTTQLVDVYGLVKTLNPEWFVGKKAVPSNKGITPTILYAEDSNFFRKQVTNYMKDEGYNVLEAEDGLIAWEVLQEHADEILLVVLDIEMPNLDGFGLAQKIRQDDRFSDMPIIAVTTLAGEEEVARGKEVGIDDYQIKLDREKLLNSIKYYLASIIERKT